MKQSVFIVITFLFVITITDVSSPQEHLSAKQIKMLGDSLMSTLSPSGLFSGMKCSNIDTVGKSALWNLDYQFFDTVTPRNGKTYYLNGENGKISLDSIGSFIIGLAVVREPWIDSDSAMKIAEGLGGALIRKQYPSCYTKAWLYRWSFPPFYLEWKIEYVCPDSVRTFRINAVTGNSIVTDVELNEFVPQAATLFPNYPNPFNPSTVINYSVPIQGNVMIIVYDALGREVRTLINEEKAAGSYTTEFNAANLSSGIYYYQIRADEFIQTKKMILLK